MLIVYQNGKRKLDTDKELQAIAGISGKLLYNQ